MKKIQDEMLRNYKNLTEEEREIIRSNQDTAYSQLLAKVIPSEVFDGLPKLKKARDLAPAGGLFSSGQGDNQRKGLI